MKPVVLAGYFGFGNAGDELIARAVRAAAPETPWRTLGVDASRWNPASLAALFRRSRALLYGGGELFQTRTSRRSLLYYAALPRWAAVWGARFLAYGMGLDPALPPAALNRAARTLDRAERVWFRDEESLALYRSAGGRAAGSVAPDPVWACGADEIPAAPPALKRVLWIPRRPLARERLAELMSKTGAAPGILLLHPREDAPEFGEMPGLESWSSWEDLPSTVAGFDAAVTMRYHGLILAALAGRPAVALAAHGKVETLARALGCPVLPPEAGAMEVFEALADAFLRRGEIRDRAEELRRRARAGLAELRGVLEAL